MRNAWDSRGVESLGEEVAIAMPKEPPIRSARSEL